MITLDTTPIKKSGGKYEMSFSGLSTDTKPEKTYKGLPIANGSSFFEMDTQNLSSYDEGSDKWV